MASAGIFLLEATQAGSYLGRSLYITVWVLAVLAGLGIMPVVVSACLSRSCLFRYMALFQVQATQQGYTARPYPATLIGQAGKAQTPLRPAGKVLIQGKYYDAKTIGPYVAVGTAVVVTGVEGSSLTVQAHV